MDHLRKSLAALLCAVLFMTCLDACGKRKEDTAAEYFGTVKVFSTYEPDKDAPLITSYSFSDVWFTGDPAEQNDALALLSMQFIAASFYETGEGSPGTLFLKELGFTETGVSVSESEDDCGYTWGRKTVVSGGETYTVVAIVVHSVYADTDLKRRGWVQNFRVNGDAPEGEHYGFKTAADSVVGEIEELGQGENVRYWITGQSRGGAVAGIIAARLIQRDPDLKGRIFAYTFEAPAMKDPVPGEDPAAEYPCIHNYLCTDDVVTMIPPWGMTRYGVTHVLNTPEVNEGVLKEFEKLKSRGFEIVDDIGDVPVAADRAERLIGVLTDSIPERKDYSLKIEDRITDAGGAEHTVSYSYQDFFVKLMTLIFSDDFSDVDSGSLTDYLEDALPMAEYLRDAVKNNDINDYYNAAAEMDAFLKNNGVELPDFGTDDFYILFKLFGPFMIDTEYVPLEEDSASERIMLYLAPAVELYMGKDSFTFSHQFDTCLARLGALSPQPQQPDIDITIDDPAAGDAVDKAPAQAEEYMASLGSPWIEIDSEWQGDDESLRDNRVHYLRSVLTVKGHSVPDGFKWTINGREPAEDPEIVYENGVYVITGVWEYRPGTPDKVKVSFDALGHADDPASLEADRGAQLKYAVSPEGYDELIEDSAGTWRFDGWYSEDGTPWEGVIADDDLVLYAGWTEIVSEVVIDVPVPRAGDKLQAPAVPEGSHYHIESWCFVDENYDEIDAAPEDGRICLSVVLSPDNGGIRFADDGSEYPGFTGILRINGEELVYNTYEDGAPSINIDADEGGYSARVEYFMEVVR
ncbi:MAG: hypothetical protein IJM62_01810 [Lachnospiraceae bacterium]|nr:hypothetical protein [Lachnospiraceae bacterium]